MASKYKPFSEQYLTFGDWLQAQKRKASYTGRIERLHTLYPKANLAQLRGHARKGQKALSLMKKVNALRNLEAMTLRQRDLYETKVLKAILRMRIDGKLSLSEVARELGTTPETVLKYAPSAFRKTPAGWAVKSSDRLVRTMKFYDAAGPTSVTVSSSKQASLIGEYHNAVKKWVEEGDDSVLRTFEGKHIKDVQGKTHAFITDKRLLNKFARSGELRFESIYQFVA